MRYEVMRLLQFVFSLSLIVGAFAGGLYVGWRRWGANRIAERDRIATRPVPKHLDDVDAPAPDSRRRPDLFAPELATTVVDLRSDVAPITRQLIGPRTHIAPREIAPAIELRRSEE